MLVRLHERPKEVWFEKVPVSKEYPRHWITTTDVHIILSDGYILSRPKGTIWDGASIPKWAWWIFKPIDEGAIADFLHDGLWTDKPAQLARHNYDIYETRLFADTERNEWRKALVPELKIKNKLTHFVIRNLGGLYYSQQLQIPT